MKIKLSILFISALVLASGCARKCPPCPMSSSTGSYGASSSYAPAPGQPDQANYNAATPSTASNYSANANARYVSK